MGPNKNNQYVTAGRLSFGTHIQGGLQPTNSMLCQSLVLNRLFYYSESNISRPEYALRLSILPLNQ